MRTIINKTASKRPWRRIICILVVLLGAIDLPIKAFSATVLETSLGDMLRDSELVFEGQVIQVEPRIDSLNRVIRTHVTINVLDVIKGDGSNDTIEISFLGGRVEAMTVRVADMSFPKPGATGIFFVESLTRQQVHPLYGWSQGHIAIVSDSLGVRRVMTEDGRPIIGVDYKQQRTHPTRVLSTGIARGLRIDPEGLVSDSMTIAAFKLALDNLLMSSAP